MASGSLTCLRQIRIIYVYITGCDGFLRVQRLSKNTMILKYYVLKVLINFKSILLRPLRLNSKLMINIT